MRVHHFMPGDRVINRNVVRHVEANIFSLLVKNLKNYDALQEYTIIETFKSHVVEKCFHKLFSPIVD